MVGSACFALGAMPAYATAVGSAADLLTFVIGSVFFTLASAMQLVQAQSPQLAPSGPTGDHLPAPAVIRAWLPQSRAWIAAAVQFPGTLYFNVTTTVALVYGLTVAQEDRHVWRPDFIGSCLFLVSSALALAAVESGTWHTWRPRELQWTMSWLNMAGSIAFMISAIGSYVLPSTDAYIDVAWSNAGTFIGAICFFLGAALMFAAWRQQSALAVINKT